MEIAQKYIEGLKKAYYENSGEKQWNDFEKIMHGASKQDCVESGRNIEIKLLSVKI